jgi:hypothetical protein
MPFRYKIFNTLRRRLRANHFFFFNFIAMRPCQSCVRVGILYVLSSESEYCKQYIRFARSYKLAISYVELDRLYRQKREFFAKATETKTKISELLVKTNRYNKQRRLTFKRIKEFSRREDQNILKLEINEMITENVKILERNKQLFILKVLNSFSPRSSFFTISVKRKGFTNPFFRLLDSPNKNVKIL